MSAPVLSAVPSVTSGAAPLAVFLDCTGTTGVTMHTGYWQHSFGDSGAGTWDNGANTSQSKNFATGIVAAHVYETPGTYYITSLCGNSAGEYDVEVNTITVTAADTQWATTKTICVSTSGNFTGAPTGSTHVTQADGDAVTAVSDNIGSGDVRILFRGGETFTAATAIALNQATGYLGSFGTGDALITATGDGVSVSANNWRIVDLDISGYSGSGKAAVIAGGNISKLTVLRLNAHDAAAYGVSLDPSANTLSEIYVADSSFDNLSDTTNAYGMYIGGTQVALIGNSIGSVTSHGIRIPKINKGVVASNTIGTTGLNTLKLNAPDFGVASEYTQNVCISDNKFAGATASINVEIGPQQTTNNERIRNVVVERNWFTATGSAQQFAASLQADLLTVRNNVVDLSNGKSDNNNGFSLIGSNSTPASSNTAILNNTFYSSATGTNLTFVIVSGTAGTGNSVINNLGYAPLSTAPVMVSDSGAVATKSNNTGNVGTLTTNPFSVAPTTPLTFVVTTASYAANGGTALFPAQFTDFYVGFDKSGYKRIGANVQDGEAQRKNVAA